MNKLLLCSLFLIGLVACKNDTKPVQSDVKNQQAETKVINLHGLKVDSIDVVKNIIYLADTIGLSNLEDACGICQRVNTTSFTCNCGPKGQRTGRCYEYRCTNDNSSCGTYCESCVAVCN